MRWARARNDPAGGLRPSRDDEAAMLALIAECDGPFKQALDQCKYPNRYPEADGALARVQAVDWLQGLEARLAGQPFLFGNHAALADDCALWAAQPWPWLQAWLAQWQASHLFEGKGTA